MKSVYIAGPYTRGDKERNVVYAIDAGEEIARMGYAVFIPHLTHYWDKRWTHKYEFWMDQDKEWLLRSDYLVRIPGESKGADLEVQWAKDHNIPVYYGVKDFLNR